MKKIITYLLIVSSIFMLTWCFGKKTVSTENTSDTTWQETSATWSTTTKEKVSAQSELSNITVSWVKDSELDIEQIPYTEEWNFYIFSITWSTDWYISNINIMIVWWNLAEAINHKEWEKTWSAKIKLSKDFITKWEAKILVQWIDSSKWTEKPISVDFKVIMQSQKTEK